MTDAPTQAELALWRLSAAGEENARLGVLLRAMGATVSSIAQELRDSGWRDEETAIALSLALGEIREQLVEALMP